MLRPNLLLTIALRHLLARKRQSLVSLMGIVLGVAFFLAISALMKGSENDFMKRLVDSSPHITLQDNYRNPRPQPLFALYPKGAVELKHVTPLPENRGIRGYKQVIAQVRALGGVRASPVLSGQGLLTFAGETLGLTMNGMVPSEVTDVTTIADNMVDGSVENLIANPDGILIGQGLARLKGVAMGDMLPVTGAAGVKTFKVVGIFSTGREGYDKGQGFVDISRAQALFGQANRANSVIMKLEEPSGAQTIADQIEKMVGYKAVSWQEASADIMNTLAIRNAIMYTVVSAVLLVAAFGIYNVISTVVAEKHRDIAILKSMGFLPREIRRIFLWQGFLLGVVGAAMGLPLGSLFMLGLGQISMKPPGASEPVYMPLDWGLGQFALAAAFALVAAMIAAYLPARKGAQVEPVDVLRGGM